MSDVRRQLVVFIGRFQPFHRGHLAIVQRALAQAEHLVILCAPCNAPRTLKNPFTFRERETMIRACLGAAERQRVRLLPLADSTYDDAAWNARVRRLVATAAGELGIEGETPALIGHKKDASSYYLDLFPDWDLLAVDNIENISATPIREAYLRRAEDALQSSQLPAAVREWLSAFVETPHYRYLHNEQMAIDADRRAWSAAPYPPVFVTTDALVEQGSDILLVERGRHPGKGLYALPGGFLDPRESLFTSCLRELREETGIICDEAQGRRYLQHQEFYSTPRRSERGRVITHVFYLRLPDDAARPEVKGGDDAKRAFWLPLSALSAERFFDDHFHIIADMHKKSGR